jgi:hypothetical protein
MLSSCDEELSSFEMLPHENVNKMYSRLNVLVDEVNRLELTEMTQVDVTRNILSVLPIEKYVHIVTVLHQVDLSTTTPTQILGRINVHKMYMHITPQEGSSSNKKKDLAFKASQEKKGKGKVKEVVLESSSEDEGDDSKIALIVRNTTNMLKKNSTRSASSLIQRSFSQVARGSPLKKWITCGKLVNSSMSSSMTWAP